MNNNIDQDQTKFADKNQTQAKQGLNEQKTGQYSGQSTTGSQGQVGSQQDR